MSSSPLLPAGPSQRFGSPRPEEAYAINIGNALELFPRLRDVVAHLGDNEESTTTR